MIPLTGCLLCHNNRMADPISFTISALAPSVSSVTAWLTRFRRGAVKMTQLTVVFFGPDPPRLHGEPRSPKVFLRTRLFSTSKRVRVIRGDTTLMLLDKLS